MFTFSNSEKKLGRSFFFNISRFTVDSKVETACNSKSELCDGAKNNAIQFEKESHRTKISLKILPEIQKEFISKNSNIYNCIDSLKTVELIQE